MINYLADTKALGLHAWVCKMLISGSSSHAISLILADFSTPIVQRLFFAVLSFKLINDTQFYYLVIKYFDYSSLAVRIVNQLIFALIMF